MTDPPLARGRPGRKRSTAAQHAILDAALAVLAERGYAQLTIEAIAAHARVGKQTIYRWWPSRGAVLLEALRRHAALEVAEPPAVSLERDVRRFLARTFRALGPPIGDALRAVVAEAQLDRALLPDLQRLIADRRAALGAVLARHGVSARDQDLVLDLAYGPMWYRLLIANAPLDDAFAARLARAIAASLAG